MRGRECRGKRRGGGIKARGRGRDYLQPLAFSLALHIPCCFSLPQGFGSGAGVFAWIRFSNFSGSESGFNTRILGTKVDRNHSKSYLLK